ncbi:hypothetical protein [Streptomyces sp. G1]|uniref:hypothetical protein n=1 Tax=Streptomyces sp. G1 TaxID=361572 RepID=UPI00202E85B8|nr:hypothetical protein [Streptomyces sp. G1]MCM1973006.1 hypothetical protein [Streptomyces sp. G1]
MTTPLSSAPHPSPRNAAEAAGLVIRAEQARLALVLHTRPGGARYLASLLDSAPQLEIMGCLAGNDVVLAVCRTWHGARKTLRYVGGDAGPDR